MSGKKGNGNGRVTNWIVGKGFLEKDGTVKQEVSAILVQLGVEISSTVPASIGDEEMINIYCSPETMKGLKLLLKGKLHL